ncbi:MAG: glycosyltransferase [Aquisalimonadaceae bacterium]
MIENDKKVPIDKLVSVIIPAYNRESFIRRTVTSVLEQTYSQVELLVTDDGSTDGTTSILTEYSKRDQLRLLSHPGRQNRGQSASINLALTEATGDYICILDSDDMFAPRKLEVLVDYLENNPEIGLVYSNGYAVDEKDNILYEIHSADHQEFNDPNRLLLDCYFLLPQNAVVRKSVFDKAGRFEEAFRSAQDHDMLLRIAEITKMAYISDFLFYYRRHRDSISAKRQDVRWRTGFEILRRAADRYPYRKETIRRRRAVLHFRTGQVCWDAGRKFQALKHLLMAGVLDPLRGLAVIFGREAIK